MTAKRCGVLVAGDLGQARDGVDAVVAVHLDQQMLAIGPHVRGGVTGELGEVALQFSGVGLGREGVRACLANLLGSQVCSSKPANVHLNGCGAALRWAMKASVRWRKCAVEVWLAWRSTRRAQVPNSSSIWLTASGAFAQGACPIYCSCLATTAAFGQLATTS
jgi:hypothetical protein